MAGTRLLLQGSFVVEFVLLACLAVYWGLYRTGDSLTHHLPCYQRGRPLIRTVLQQLQSAQNVVMPRISMAVSSQTQQQQQQQQQHDLSLIQQALLQDKRLAQLLQVVSVDADRSKIACDNNLNGVIGNETDFSNYSIWLCPQQQQQRPPQQQPQQHDDDDPPKKAKMVIHNGTTFIYYSHHRQLIDALASAFQTTTIDVTKNTRSTRQGRRKPLQFTVMMEPPRRDWRAWATALEEWIAQHEDSIMAWPCIRPSAGSVSMESQVMVSPLVGKSSNSKKQQHGNDDSSTRSISIQDVKDAIINVKFDAINDDNDQYWNIVLYVPRVAPAFFVNDSASGEESEEAQQKQQQQSMAMYLDHTFITTIDQAEITVEQVTTTTTTDVPVIPDEDDSTNTNETTTVSTTTTTNVEAPVPLETLVSRAMTPINEFLFHQCLGQAIEQNPLVAPVVLNDDWEVINKDNSFPIWQWQVALQQMLTDAFHQAITETSQEGEWLLQSSTWVVIDESVAAHWETLASWIQSARQRISTTSSSTTTTTTTIQSSLEALSILEEALVYLEFLRTDPTLMEPLRFSPPQLLAIFAPLCLPLFLPHFIGLIREWKRYKKLRQKGQASTTIR